MKPPQKRNAIIIFSLYFYAFSRLYIICIIKWKQCKKALSSGDPPRMMIRRLPDTPQPLDAHQQLKGLPEHPRPEGALLCLPLNLDYRWQEGHRRKDKDPRGWLLSRAQKPKSGLCCWMETALANILANQCSLFILRTGGGLTDPHKCPAHTPPARVSWGQLPAGQVTPLEIVPSLCCSKYWHAPNAGRSDSQQIPGWKKPRKHSSLLLFISNIWHWGKKWGLCSGSHVCPPALPLPSWKASDKQLDWCLSFPI